MRGLDIDHNGPQLEKALHDIETDLFLYTFQAPMRGQLLATYLPAVYWVKEEEMIQTVY